MSAETVFELIAPLMRGDREYFNTAVNLTLWEKDAELLTVRRTCVIWQDPIPFGGEIKLEVRGQDMRYEAAEDTLLTALTAVLPGTGIVTPGWPTREFNARQFPYVMRPGDTWTLVLPR